jgi:aspartate/methionine/tyrosine aminotransferase
MKSTEYTQKLFEEERVRVVAGSTFGEMGEGHIRIALVAPIEKIDEAINRIERLHKKLEKH